ncbi:hypothetical protein KM043_006105 [Ampulex compressa]|nr:hypothetical protein KM043_006105 [Ampulex compressa]
MPLFYAGLNATPLFAHEDDTLIAVDSFAEISWPGLTDAEIGWNYLLLWQDTRLYVYLARVNGDCGGPRLVHIPGSLADGCERVVTNQDSIIVLSIDHCLWRYKFYDDSWKRISTFIPANDGIQCEYPVKISQGRCTVVLSNLGRVFNVPALVKMPKRIKFVDIACGFDHTVMLAENGNVFSMGIGTRGQLGHDDLEDQDDPRLVEALAGIKVVQISAGGWHSAVVTDQGDLYTWGWNTCGELGVNEKGTKVIGAPALIDFKDQTGGNVDVRAKKVQCGNNFTVCMMEDGSFWGAGSNKYGQLGQPRRNFRNFDTFTKLSIDIGRKPIKDFKCREWGTILVTDQGR